MNNPVKYVDPTGRFLGEATFFGALSGALIGGAAKAVAYSIKSGSTFTWTQLGNELAKGVYSGALAGAAAGLVIDTCGVAAPALGLAFAAGATSGIVGSYSEKVLDNYDRGQRGADMWSMSDRDVSDIGYDGLFSGLLSAGFRWVTDKIMDRKIYKSEFEKMMAAKRKVIIVRQMESASRSSSPSSRHLEAVGTSTLSHDQARIQELQRNVNSMLDKVIPSSGKVLDFFQTAITRIRGRDFERPTPDCGDRMEKHVEDKGK